MPDRLVRTNNEHRTRILLISPSSPFPPDSGGAQRTALLYEALAEDATVDLLLLERAHGGERARSILTNDFRMLGSCADRSRLLRRAYLRLASLISPHFRSALRDRQRAAEVARLVEAGGYDAIVLRYSATACQLLGLRKQIPGVRIYVDSDDFLTSLAKAPQSFSTLGGSVERLVQPWASSWISRRERRALLESDGLWVTGIRPTWLGAGSRIVELPNIPFHPPPGKDSRGNVALNPVIFLGVGQFRYLPNAEGFDWFLRHVWPQIRRALPEARLRLVGLPPSEPRLSRWRAMPGVEIAGRLDSLEAEYASATVAIAPILGGGGTKIKVLEALAMGLPCVCSRHAAAGLDVLTSLLVADDAESFAQLCIELAADASRRKSHAARGRREVEHHFSRAKFLFNVRLLVQPGIWPPDVS